MQPSRCGPSSRPAARAFPVLLAAAGLLLAGTGCETSYPSLTCGLWTGNVLRSFNEPAADPAIRIYQSVRPPDLLVTYDESLERNDQLRRRAFYLQANLERLRAGRKPRFVSASRTNGLIQLAAGSATGAPSPTAGPAST